MENVESNREKVLVLGLSKSGIAAAKLAKKRGKNVFLSEGKQIDEEGLKKVSKLETLGINVEYGGHSDNFIKNSTLAITSPGIAPHSEILTRIKQLNPNIRIISELQFAFDEVNDTNKKFIVITGTNGKTTTTSLIEHILISAGIKAKACGNIGLPPSEIVDEDIEYFVCESSSFQLDMTDKFSPYISLWTNFTPDHVDWHQGLENYFKAKTKAFRCANYRIFNANDEKLLEYSKQFESEKDKVKRYYFDKNLGDTCCYIEDGAIKYRSNSEQNLEIVLKLSECPIIGHHNYQNIMCAVIVAELVGIPTVAIRKAVMSFVAPPHRLEKIRELKGITFYNDSKATNPEAAIVAINSFNGTDVALIAGGRDKNTDLTEFSESIKNHIKTVILIGEATDRFEKELKHNGFSNIIREKTLESAVDKGIELNPDVVLLSPACASFDMFSGYEQRGDVFREYVLSKV
jgi:UDP-N-acetylmuramoylalanine--D-glutamate ligase